MRWSVNSQIRVAPRTCTYAELNIDEEEFQGDFSVFIRFFGRITATIATRQSPDTYIKLIDGDIIQIIRETLETNHRLNGLEILEGNPTFVQYTMRGKCAFRYGIEQHIVLNQKSLDQSPSSFLIPNPRSFPTSNTNIHLQIVDDEL